MSLLVVDSSVMIASVFVEAYSSQAASLLSQVIHAEDTIHAPALLHYELMTVVRKSVYLKRISEAEGRSIRDRLLGVPINLHFSQDLIKRAYELAEDYNLSKAYDSQYLALAESLECTLWTADDRLYNAVRRVFPAIRRLGELQD